MTRTKRWITLASSLALAAGTGYGGYTQRHLILGEGETAEVAAETETETEATAEVEPIRVTPGEEMSESPSSFDNPLRRASHSTYSDERVVRGNDDGSDPSPAGNRFAPPPLYPEDDASPAAAPSSRFGGSAVARVEVADEGEPSPATLAPPPAYPSGDAQVDNNTNSFSGNRFAPPAETAPVEAAPAANRFAPPASTTAQLLPRRLWRRRTATP